MSRVSHVVLVCVATHLWGVGCGCGPPPAPEARNPRAPILVIVLDAASATSGITERREGLPHFALDDVQRKAVQAALEELEHDANTTGTSNEQLTFRLLQLNCYACQAV